MTHQPHTVLIVDDTVENLRVLGEMLELDGHEVRIASQGVQALEMARLSPPDLILLDVMMPGMDGHEVCRRLKAQPDLADIPVIFLTALTDEADEALGLDLGAVDYVTKPFKMNLVRKRIHNHLILRQLQVERQETNARLEEQVAERTRELSDANRRLKALDSTKSLFLRLLSQEVQAPANGMVGIGQLALASIEDSAKRQRLQSLFESNKRHLESILEQYQRLVTLQERRSGSRLHPVRLEEAIDTAWASVSEAAGAKSLSRTVPSGRSFIVAGDLQLLVDALGPLLGALVDQARPGTALTCTITEAAERVELNLAIAIEVVPEGTPCPLEEWKVPGDSLSLPAVVVGALGGMATVDSAKDGTLTIHLVFESYRP